MSEELPPPPIEAPLPAAAVKLWGIRPILIATIIGSPVAGCILMALN